jgi:hypothetical protein
MDRRFQSFNPVLHRRRIMLKSFRYVCTCDYCAGVSLTGYYGDPDHWILRGEYMQRHIPVRVIACGYLLGQARQYQKEMTGFINHSD